MVIEQEFYLTLGAIGWEQDRWLDEFYPHDLPCEWRLSYYANEFPVVLVPEAYWFKAQLPDIRQWLDDVPDSFRFHILVTQRLVESVQWHDVVCLFEELKPCLGGWVLELLEEVAEPFKQRLREIQAQIPIVTLNNGAVGTPACWRRDDTTVCGAIGIAEFTKRADVRILRAVIEDFISRSSGECRALFLDAPYRTVSDARTIIRLLGF